MNANSVGHHENYSTPLVERRSERDLSALHSYLATRPLWAGAGFVTKNGFQLSQKASGTDYATRNNSELVKHGHKRATRLQIDRLEIRSGDGNMSPWAIRTKFAMTSLVLRLIERGEFPEELIFNAPTLLQNAARTASSDPLQTFNTTTSPFTAASHQLAIARVAHEFAQKHAVPAEEIQAAEDVLAVADELQNNDSILQSAEKISNRVDWAAKWTVIQRKLGASGVAFRDITTQDFRAIQYDMLWEALDETSVSARYYRALDNVVDPKVSLAALHSPPDTRAAVRNDYLEIMPSGVARVIDWHYITHFDKTTFRMPSAYPDGLDAARDQIALLKKEQPTT